MADVTVILGSVDIGMGAVDSLKSSIGEAYGVFSVTLNISSRPLGLKPHP